MKDPTKQELEIISAICDRALSLSDQLTNRLELFMDIEYSHRDISLDLQRLLDFDDNNFMHDVTGIVCHFNRETLKVEDFFLPRCATFYPKVVYGSDC